MPRYLIERTFKEGLNLPGPDCSEQDRQDFIDNNTSSSVERIYSIVSPDRKISYCIYDAPTTEALRLAAIRNKLPVDRITEVSLLEPKGA